MQVYAASTLNKSIKYLYVPMHYVSPFFFLNIILLEITWPQMGDEMRSPYRTKRMNDGMLTEDLVTWRHCNVILESKVSNQSLLKYLSLCTLLFLYPAISETYQNNGNNITLSNISSYNCFAKLLVPLVSSNSSYAYILQQSLHISLLPDHLNVICWQGNIFFLKI